MVLAHAAGEEKSAFFSTVRVGKLAGPSLGVQLGKCGAYKGLEGSFFRRGGAGDLTD